MGIGTGPNSAKKFSVSNTSPKNSDPPANSVDEASVKAVNQNQALKIEKIQIFDGKDDLLLKKCASKEEQLTQLKSSHDINYDEEKKEIPQIENEGKLREHGKNTSLFLEENFINIIEKNKKTARKSNLYLDEMSDSSPKIRSINPMNPYPIATQSKSKSKLEKVSDQNSNVRKESIKKSSNK